MNLKRPENGIKLRASGWLLAAALCAWSVGASAAPLDLSKLPPSASRPVDFAKDIQPLFAKACYGCHGPEKQKSGFRLDSKSAAIKGGENYTPAIKPGSSAESPLIHLVAGLVPDQKMPAKGDPLTPEQIGLLRAWIDQGAAWPDDGRGTADLIQSHWSFRKISKPPVPKPATSNPIDAFIAQKLETRGLALAAEADRTSLMRRLYLVMLGVPPAPEEVAAFVSDRSPEVFERLVDKVLADPRYGERWGRHWLDVIRFAESNGFETNRERPTAWRFRDYIIQAFNQDKPYDRFIREQIAGDALGVDVATGFLVGGPVDIVGSPDPVLTAQQRADQIDDMVSTTGTAFLGLTLGCARCHSHKFDPVEHREYYALSAMFAGVRHGERAQPLPPERAAELAKIEASISDLEQKLAPFSAAAQAARSAAAATPSPGQLRPPVNPRMNEEILVPVEAKYVRLTILATSQSEPCLDELEVWSGGKNVALASTGTKATASSSLPGYEIHKLAHVNDGKVGNSHSWIANESGRGWVQLELAQPARLERIVWGRDREGQFSDRLATHYRIEVARDPGKWQLAASSDDREPFQGRIDPIAGPAYRFKGLPVAETERGSRWLAGLEEARRQRDALTKAPMVYAGTFSQPGATYRLNRGDPMQKREAVAPGTLAIFEPLHLAAEAPEQERRVKLAEWIAHPENPLTARVLVNRIWQYQFGVGLVETPNDFGRNGSPPTHPELLDWLAGEFIAHGWSLKWLQRQILLSATWRQSSVPRPASSPPRTATRSASTVTRSRHGWTACATRRRSPGWMRASLIAPAMSAGSPTINCWCCTIGFSTRRSAA